MFKNRIKIFILVCVFFIAIWLLIPKQILATSLDVGIELTTKTGLGAEDVRSTVAKIANTALGVLGIVVIVIMIYAGYVYFSAQGDKEKIDKARKIFMTSLIGLILILAAYAITFFILSQILKATGVEMVNTPASNTNNTNNINEPSGGGEGGGGGGLPEPEGNEGYTIDINGTKTQIKDYAIAKSVATFYSYSSPNASSANIQKETAYDFSNMMATNRVISFIYTDDTDPAALKYYLVLIEGKAGTGGNFDAKITGANDDFSFVVKDEPSTALYPTTTVPAYDAYSDNGSTILVHNVWAKCCSDGEVIYLGDGTQPMSFKLTVNSFTAYGSSNPQWYFFTPDNPSGILVSSTFPASIDINYQPKQNL